MLISRFLVPERVGFFGCIALLAIGGVMTARADEPVSTDLWDISQGTIVTSNTALQPGFDARDMIGGHFSLGEGTRTLFKDGQPGAFIHSIEWTTLEPLAITSFHLIVEGDNDGLGRPAARSISAFTLLAWDHGEYVPYYVLSGIEPYVGQAEFSATVTPPVTDRFRAEFTQANLYGSYAGPRITELDGFGTVVMPEPATLALLAVGGLALLRRR